MTNSQINDSRGAARRPPQFAFFHNECRGFLHVDLLGSGVQGTATLVRDAQTGQLIVRKRSAFVQHDEEPFADQFRLSHPNILQLIGFQNYGNERGECASATYWPYANDNSLSALCRKYRKAGDFIPEVLIWQCLAQLLRAYEALHKSGRSHNDGHSANVFLHWDGSSVLPEVILGDLGMCGRLPMDLTTLSEDIDLKDPDLVQKNENTNAGLDHVLGLPTLEQLHRYDEDETCATIAGTTMEQYCLVDALRMVGGDMSAISECISGMMFDPGFGNGPYSQDLDTMAAMLYNLRDFARSMYIRTLPRWRHLYTHLRYAAEQGLSNAIGKASFPVKGLESFGPAPVDSRPVLFETLEALHACDERPPGPWSIAAVDPDTLQILEVDRTTYCADNAGCTDSKGFPAAKRPDDIECTSELSEIPSNGKPPCHCGRPHIE